MVLLSITKMPTTVNPMGSPDSRFRNMFSCKITYIEICTTFDANQFTIILQFTISCANVYLTLSAINVKKLTV